MKNLYKVLKALFILAGLSAYSMGGAQDSLTFVQLCDPQLGMGGYQHDSVALVQAVNQINEISPDFVVICGDLVHFANDTSYSDLKSILSHLEVPCFAAPGNHDVENDPTVESLEYYRNTIGDDYYMKDTLGYAFVFVNSTLWTAPLDTETDMQDEWLNEVMTGLSDEQGPVFVVAHHPLFLKTSDEETPNSPISLEKRTELLTLFSQSGVVGYLAGHTHTTLIYQFDDIQLVCGATTSRNFDGKPLGFRLWNVSDSTATHEFVPLVVQDLESF